MNRESVSKLRLDRRLLDRRGWLSTGERTSALVDLPDVAEKGISLGEASDERSADPQSGDAGAPGA